MPSSSSVRCCWRARRFFCCDRRLAEAISRFPRLSFRGFMGIARARCDVSAQRQQFRTLRLLFEQARARGLRVDTLSNQLARHNIDHVDFLKLDAQGAELAILRGAEDLIRRSVLGL